METTHFSQVDWIVAWDPQHQGHCYLKGGDLVFCGNEITFVGQGYDGPADRVVVGAGLCLIPGFVNIHSHPASEVFFRGIREDHSVPEHHMTGLYERSCAYGVEPEALRFGQVASYCELLRSGVTTLVDISVAFPGWTEVMAQSGIRGYAAPGFGTSRWRLENRHQLKFIQDEACGRSAFEATLELIDGLCDHPSGRLSGVVSPMQIENCSAELLVESAAAARDRGLPWTLHASQAVLEFNEIVDRHGVTPIQWLDQLGVLGDQAILGHAIFTDSHSWTRWHSHRDRDLLAESGTSVAHCPTPFMRYGAVLEDFSAYRAAGINLGIGTDTMPHNMLEDMRAACVLGRVASQNGTAATTGEVFHAATLGGAKALGREDLGRLAPGAKADFAVIDLAHPLMMPLRDPLRSLVHSAAERALRDLYIDGRQVVKDHEVLTLDHAAATRHLAEPQARMEAGVPQRDFAGRSSQEVSPLSLPMA